MNFTSSPTCLRTYLPTYLPTHTYLPIPIPIPTYLCLATYLPTFQTYLRPWLISFNHADNLPCYDQNNNDKHQQSSTYYNELQVLRKIFPYVFFFTLRTVHTAMSTNLISSSHVTEIVFICSTMP